MTGISAVVITKNEERNIARCLESVKGLVDEIIVVDSFSTDKTKEIAESFGAKFYEKEWQGYAGSKNLANSLASNKYILSLDADEEISSELAEGIAQQTSNGLQGVYRMNRLSNYCGKWIKHCGWYPDPKFRLFPKEIASWEGDHVHETIIFKEEPKITKLEGHILHYSYYSIEEHLQRIKKYSRLGALKLAEKNKTGGWLKAMYKSAARFISCYIFRLGILDGYYGWVICKNTAYAIYLKYIYLNEIRKEKT
ncbi:MAG: glycosyltransferase family 2 protein [Bacteroidia bacterium]|nr:glycosyltransferase family 2 protein [Bacteroidia bacterium]